jgi:hypothetical protein
MKCLTITRLDSCYVYVKEDEFNFRMHVKQRNLHKCGSCSSYRLTEGPVSACIVIISQDYPLILLFTWAQVLFLFSHIMCIVL